MTGGRAAWLAWSAWGVALAFGLGALALVLDNGAAAGESFLPACFVPGFATVGAVVSARARAAGAVGWLLLGVALVAAVGAFSAQYAFSAYVASPGSLPAPWLAAWAMDWLLVVLVAGFGSLLLLFPDGSLPGPGWRPVAWGLGAAFGLLTLGFMVRQPIDVAGARVLNPLGAAAASGAASSWPVIGAAAASLLAAVLAPFWRWRRAGAAERQQLKWLALATVVAGAALALLPLGYLGIGTLAPFVVLLVATAVGIPLAVGIAVLRHGLYDIDRLLNRTVVYGLLSAVLALCYGTVSLVAVLVVGIGADPPSWLVAAATLATAALAQPARRGIQGAVDRRFNRRKYDAALTVAAFSRRVRGHIDLGALTGDLVAVVERTVEPTSVSVWLRRAG